MMEKIKTLFIVGPTASGKTDLSIKLANKFNGEIVSADSMQIYRGMNIGTAKPSAEEMQSIPHHLIDVCDITEDFSVADYSIMAKKTIIDIYQRGKLPIITGGTGLYVDSILYNTKFADYEDNPQIRKNLIEELQNNGAEFIYNKLCNIDPEAAEKLHINDTKRVIRAIECYYLTGKTKTQHDKDSRTESTYCDPLIIGLNYKLRDNLYNRINLRVDLLIKKGLIDEVKSLLQSGILNFATASQAIGYKELIPYIKGEQSLEEATEKLKMETRRYAKRQLTWFRKNDKIKWLYPDEDKDISQIATVIIEDFLRR